MSDAPRTLDPERLGHVSRAMRPWADSERPGGVPGLVWGISRGDETYVEAVGARSLGGPAMEPDTPFRIASLTKPVTAVAALRLTEDGVLDLDAPVDDRLPELANRRVLRSPDGPLDDTVPARRPVTARDLLTLTFGLGAVMKPPGTDPIQDAMEAAGVAPGPDPFDGTGDEYLRRLGGLPLIRQPGERFLYETGFVVLGILLARAAGRSLGAVLRETVFAPLGMEDTGFTLDAGDVERVAACYARDPETKRLVPYADAPDAALARPPRLESGSAGLVSTAADYLTFQRALLEGRLLSAASHRLLTSDRLTPEQRRGSGIFFGEYESWAMGGAVTIHRGPLWHVPGRYGWDGGKGTSAYTDFETGQAALVFTQVLMDSPAMPPAVEALWTALYEPTGPQRPGRG